MTCVLVVDSLCSFLEATAVPAHISAKTFSEATGVPPGEVAGIIPVVTTRITAADMDQLSGLRVVANYGVGYDNIDIAAARTRGILVSNTPGVLTDATAELTWALILSTARRLGEGERLVRSGGWRGWKPTQLRGLSLKGKTLGIVGAGRIGREVGNRAAAFGMHVIYWSRTQHAQLEFQELDALLRTADVVSIHLSKSGQTEGLIDARRLALLKNGAVLVNTARGAIVDETALIAQLKTGRISAGLDVYVDEPRVSAELLALDNVVLLPHLGSATYEARQAMWDLAWENLMRGVAGKELLNPI